MIVYLTGDIKHRDVRISKVHPDHDHVLTILTTSLEFTPWEGMQVAYHGFDGAMAVGRVGAAERRRDGRWELVLK